MVARVETRLPNCRRDVDVETYLQRIGYDGPRDPTADTLRLLQRAHMFSVPFENLDIHLGNYIDLLLPSFYDKIVRRRRGGFCYELNGLFAWLLERLGFGVTLHSGRVFTAGQPGPEFDHLVLRVDLEERWVADVGFGDSFLEPLRLDPEAVVEQQGSRYSITEAGDERTLQRRRGDAAWEPQYVFTLIPRKLPEFSAMCHQQQTSPESVFTRKSVCSLATPRGRVTLSGSRLIVTTEGLREERPVASEAEYRQILRTRFGVELGRGSSLQRVMAAPSN